MCGIVGILNLDNRGADRSLIERMNEKIRHRGPDDAGSALFGPAGLAMRRLSIIDVAGGHQPIANEDDSVWVVMNGEIYNHLELRAELESAGHRFRTRCDTEVLVHAYEAWGDRFAEKLNGMFGFALWDDRRKRLIVGRDRLGIKPIYYHHGARVLAFASEMKSLFVLDEVSNEIDPVALDEFMTLEYVLAPRTLCRDIRKLEPGHLLVVQDGKVEKVRYWTPDSAVRYSTFEEAMPALESEMRAAVKRHMIADVPLGAFLSGGIDSSIIVGLMAEMSPRVKTFSIGFENASYNELAYSRQVANHFGTDHEEHTLRPDPRTFLDDFVGYLDEPIGDTSIFPTFLVSQVTRRKVKVALSGDGGDELFGGYDHYLADRASRAYRRWVPSPARGLVSWAAGRLPPTEKKKGAVNKLKRFVEGDALRSDIEHYRWMSFLSDSQRADLFSDAFRASVPSGVAYARLLGHFADSSRFGEATNRQSYVDLNVYLSEDILVKVDVASMANSLEVRVPFLDANVVQLALSMSGGLKIDGWDRKAILKRTFSRLLPDGIVNRRKEGFSMPLKNWLRGELQGAMREVLNRETIEAEGTFRWDAVSRLMDEHVAGSHNHAHRLWCLMVYHLWRKKYLTRVTAANDYAEAANCSHG